MKSENQTTGQPQVGSDAGLGFARAMTAATRKACEAYSITADRIIAGTWSESELCPAMQEYVNQRRHLHTPAWIKPNTSNQTRRAQD
jgi:hypothetical protein